MDFQFQHDFSGEELPEEWHVLLARQARILEDILSRVAETVTAVNTRPERKQEQMQRLHHLFSESERFLTTLAQQYVGLERETSQFQASSRALEGDSPETARQLHIIEQVTAALHANITTARQYLADVRQTIERMTTGA